MANELDEMTGPVNEQGRDVNVIEKQIPAKVGKGTYVFVVCLFILGIIPGLIFLAVYQGAKNYLKGLQQKIQHDASQIDNYLEQRVIILQNLVPLLNKAIDLDKDVLTKVTALRSGNNINGDASRNEVSSTVDNVSRSINVALEAYPDIKAHKEIADAMQQNSYLQREITAAREVYNDSVSAWNQAIFQWPAKALAAARAGYTTRIPFTASKETKEAARQVFFN